MAYSRVLVTEVGLAEFEDCNAICRYDNQGGAAMTAVKLSDQRGTGGGRSDRRCTISAVKDEALGANGQPAYIQVA